jgi:GNAT superfamily N-acetyltransferase
MTIRDARTEDLPAIAELIRALARYERLEHEVVWTESQLGETLFGADAVPKVLLAESDGRVVGMALWFWTYSTFLGQPGIWLEDLFVRPEHRGAGHGRALLDALRTRTSHRVEWNVLDWNEPAQGFYRNLGAFPMDDWTTWRWLPPTSEPDASAS